MAEVRGHHQPHLRIPVFRSQPEVLGGLTDSQKEAINKAVAVSIKEITEATKKGDAELIRLTEEKGLKVTYPDLVPFRQAAVPIIEEFLKKTPDAEPIYREIVEAGKKFEKK